jgi:hypothetical protein
MSALPLKPETLLSPGQLVEALAAEGHHYSLSTFVTYRSTGQGPPFVKNSRSRAIGYPWGLALEWARGEVSPPVRSNREAKKEWKKAELQPKPAAPRPRGRPKKAQSLSAENAA